MPVILIADSGATKSEWCLLNNGKSKTIFTQGISPYFLSKDQIIEIISTHVSKTLKNIQPDEVYYYGTGCANIENARMMKQALRKVYAGSKIEVNTDLLAAARAVCGHNKGVACILGTGSNSCFFNGNKIIKNSPGIGYVLGDEGSGAYLGKKVIQYYLYNTFDEDLRARFDAKFVTSSVEILDNVYKKPLPNKYLAGFTMFLAENRGHYMVENILEDGLNDFFFYHLCKYAEIWKHPVSFVGSVALGFKDIIEQLCQDYEFDLGVVLKNPMPGLITYHSAHK